MAIFPNLGPEYYDENHRHILKRMEDFYTNSISLNQAFWGEADTDHRFEAGDQTVWNDIYGNLPAYRRKHFNFNRIRRIINMISGRQRITRKSIIAVPIENGDSVTADQLTKVIMWAVNQENMLETISEAFNGALITGMNLLHLWVDYRSDPINGNIKLDNCSYNSFLIDPYFRKKDLSDCNGIWKRTYLTKREVISLLPDKKEEVMELSPLNGNKDGKFQFMPESYQFDVQKLLTYDEFYYRDYRTQKLLVDTRTNETIEWTSGENEDLKQFLSLYPEVDIIDQDIPTVKLAIVVQGKVMYDGPNPMGIDNYPFVPVLGYYKPEIPYFSDRVQGVVRGLRDAQYLYNRRRIIELDILESQLTSGFKYKENALVNPKDIFLSGQGKGLALKQEAQMSDVEQIQPPQVPGSMIQLSELLAREVMEISGVNEELLGSAVDDKAGILSRLRQNAGLTTLQSLFDNLDQAQLILGNLMIKIIQNNFTPGKIRRIIEEDPTREFYNKNFGKYDAAVEEGFNTATQRQLAFAQLLDLNQVGVPIPHDYLIEASTVQNKQKLIEAIQAQKQQQIEMQQQQQQLQIENQIAQNKLVNAQAIADEGLGVERLSRVQENRALALERQAQAREKRAQAIENRASAAKDREAALLNFVKALKEIESIDIANLQKMIELSKQMDLIRKEEEFSQPEPELEEPTPTVEEAIDLQTLLSQTGNANNNISNTML